MAIKYLGYGYTNAKGIAVLEKDPNNQTLTNSYTGVGAGKIDIIAKCGTLQSEAYPLYDCLVIDTATTLDYNDIWTLSQEALLTRQSGYTVLTEATAGTTATAQLNSSNKIPNECIVEFDFRQIDGATNTSPIYIRNNGGGSSLGSFSLYHINKSVNEWIHLKIIFDGSTNFEIYADDSDVVNRTLSNIDTNYRIYFSTGSDITELQFKNFKVY